MNCRHCGYEITAHDADYGKIDECRECAHDVDRYVGHMIWDHKTAPALEIHANAKSLAALRDGRERAGGHLIHEVKERSRRRESDISSGSDISLSPYVRGKEMVMHGSEEELPKVSLRSGTGKTVATYSRDVIEKISAGDQRAQQHLKDLKLQLAKAVSKIQLNKLAGWSITVWHDSDGYYVIPRKSSVRSVLDHETIRQVGYRTANYRKF